MPDDLWAIRLFKEIISNLALAKHKYPDYLMNEYRSRWRFFFTWKTFQNMLLVSVSQIFKRIVMDFNLSFTAGANPEEMYDVIIIGGGPAGLTAGMYTARYKLKSLMIEKMPVAGGQMTSTQWVENYPGFPEPILGQKLAQDMEKQAKMFGLQIINEDVNKVKLQGNIKLVHTPYAVWKAKSILISTGSSPRKLNVPGEAEFKGNGVSYCATCDGPFYPEKILAVVGGGNTAFEESTFLAKYASKIYLLHHSDQYRADAILQDRVKQNSKIEIMPFQEVHKIDFGNPEDKKLLLHNTRDNTESLLPVDGIFIFIGNVPNTKLFEGQLKLENGYIVTDRAHHTSVKGVWAAGDVQSKALRQVATAVGDGACAAHWINKYIEDWKE
jgi:thioredoxin reductase (NADPH)